eukprot:scaffold2602_cov177-Ochromonas_danica.AAC.17
MRNADVGVCQVVLGVSLLVHTHCDRVVERIDMILISTYISSSLLTNASGWSLECWSGAAAVVLRVKLSWRVCDVQLKRAVQGKQSREINANEVVEVALAFQDCLDSADRPFDLHRHHW